MNNYQVQQLNDTIAFAASIMALAFVAIMVKQTFSSEEPKRYWLVYVTPEGKWGAWDITPHKPTLILHKENPKKYLKEWGEYYYLDAEAQVERGRFAKYWISEATTRYRAIRNIQVMALPEHYSSVIGTYPTKADWGLGPLYHGTTISRANEIRIKGLRLSKDGIVWLAYSFEDALGRAKELSSEVGEPPAVLKVNLPKGWRLERAEAGVYLSHAPIPLRYISKERF